MSPRGSSHARTLRLEEGPTVSSIRARVRLAAGAALATVLLAATTLQAPAQITTDAPAGRPTAIIDLATEEGVRLVKGQWRYRDARIHEVAHRAPGPDLRRR